MWCTRLAENTGRKKVAKNRHLDTIAQLCRAISSQLRHISTIGKKLVKQQNISSRCPHNMVNLGPLAAPQLISTGFASWQRYCTTCSSGRQPNFTALNRGCHLRLAGRPSRWALAHISSFLLHFALQLRLGLGLRLGLVLGVALRLVFRYYTTEHQYAYIYHSLYYVSRTGGERFESFPHGIP